MYILNTPLKNTVRDSRSSHGSVVGTPSRGISSCGTADSDPSITFLRKNSLEYIFYASSFIVVVCYLGVYDMIVVSNENREKLGEFLLRPWIPFGWLFSRGIDRSDLQWYNFSLAIPFIPPVFLLYLYISRKLRKRAISGKASALHLFHAGTGLLVAFGISGPGFIYALILILGNYYFIAPLHRRLPFAVFMAIMWSVHIGLLFINNYFNGYGFEWLGIKSLQGNTTPLIMWTVHYNMNVLRMIAFNTDYFEASTVGADKSKKIAYKHDTTCVECAQISELNSDRTDNCLTGEADHLDKSDSLRCYKYRTEHPRRLIEYNLWSYLGYILYPPLYIAGPMSSFNAYASYVLAPTQAYNRAALVEYGLRVLMSFVLMTTALHYIYVGAIVAEGSVIQTLSFTRRVLILYISLGYLWMKFNCIWKLFRLLALLDGFDVPEDMRRCFSNTVSIQGFWRDWHASFNLWIVRYMYIPMGGSKNKYFTIFPIFFFIAIWHDIELRLLYWAGIMCCCLIPELLVTKVLLHPKGRLHIALSRRPLLYRYVRVFGAVVSMIELIIGNLVGFRISTGSAMDILSSFWTDSTFTFIVVTPIILYFSAHVAIQDRDEKAYQEQQNRIKYGLSTSRSTLGHSAAYNNTMTSPTNGLHENRTVPDTEKLTEIYLLCPI